MTPRRLRPALLALVLALALLLAGRPILFEDGSGRIYGQPFCIPMQLCAEE